MRFFAPSRSLFYREMAKLLAAGFGIREAAAVLKDTRNPAHQIKWLERMERGLDAGLSIRNALAENGGEISEMELVIIGAGERGGRLATAFQHLAEYFELLESAQRSIRQSLIYPVVVLHLGIFISVVPMAMLDGDPHWLGRLLLMLIVAYSAGGLLFFGIRALFAAAPDHVAIDRFLQKLPLIGKARSNLAMARFTKVYHTCLLAGLTISECIEKSSAASNSGGIREAGNALLEVAKNGNSVGAEFIAQSVFPGAFSRSYATAEVSGTLDIDLERWSQRFQEEAETSMRTLAATLPKVAYALVLIFVIWKILGFYSEYYEKLDQISE